MGAQSVAYVFIPADINEPIEEQHINVPEGKEVECLLDVMKAHFKQQGKKTSEQKARQIEELKQKMKQQQGDLQGTNVDQLLEAATGFTMAEPIPLLSNSKETRFVGVNMYVDDSGAIKELPVNRRASEIAACCGNHIQQTHKTASIGRGLFPQILNRHVHGDAYVARFKDDEDTFERMNFKLQELSSSAPWVKLAKEQADRRQKEGGAAAFMQQINARNAATGPSGRTDTGSAKIKELTPAEAAKEEGNAAFKKQDFAKAIELYSQAIQQDPNLTSAVNNRAACYVKLEQWKEALQDCDAVIAKEPQNVKALLRRAAARRHLGDVQGASGDVAQVLKLQPQNKDALALQEQLSFQ